ncbi:MAG: hypothetical protein IJW75_00845, partial [Alphaproteobacteria bacterium]|nr:hypothetical protein [Alphaproteobacteria bacterium]
MKKILILMLCCIMYINNAHSKVCFLASPDCEVGASKSNKSDSNSNQTECPAEYNLSENQLCEAHKYQTCLNEKTGISLYKDLGCDRAAGYYAINSQTTDKKYICDAEVCGGCCNEFRCSDDYKSCLSEEYENAVGEGDTCTEKHEKYYVNDSPDKFLECNCDTEKYPYSINNCSDTLSGAHCKGDNGVYWQECVKACIGYPYKSCPASAIKCETCESGGVTYYKAIECNESDGYYHSDGECKPRDCSDYHLSVCPVNKLCDTKEIFDNSTTRYNNICITAGQEKYQLNTCTTSYFTNDLYFYLSKNKMACEPIPCAHFNLKQKPANAEYEK